MVKTLELPDYLNQCPSYWRNFLTNVKQKSKGNFFHDPIKFINVSLKPYDMKVMMVDNRKLSLMIDNEEAFLFFVLKYT